MYVCNNIDENKLGKQYKRLPSQGHVKMAYRCGKFNAYCLLSSRVKTSAQNEKMRLHIFGDVGVVAAGFFWYFKLVGPGLNPGRVITVTPRTFLKKTPTQLSVYRSTRL